MRSIAEALAYNRRYAPKLNPLLFNDDKELLSPVREKVLEIVKAFLEYIQLEVKVLDIRLVGSNASYNYNNHSDLDIHIVIDLSKVSEPELVARLYFDSVKKNFKDAYDITIKGIDVEIYVEDVNATAVSNGIYSVTKDKWIKDPKVVDNPTDEEIDKAEEIEDEIMERLESTDDIDELSDILDDIYLMRKDSLSTDGENGAGNLAFKSLRNKGVLDQIKDAMRGEESKELSLENKEIHK